MLIDSSGGVGCVRGGCTRRWGGEGYLLCGQDQFTRRYVDACLHCENSLSSETPGIPWPPKGGRLCDLSGMHSSQSLGSKSRGRWGPRLGTGALNFRSLRSSQ